MLLRAGASIQPSGGYHQLGTACMSSGGDLAERPPKCLQNATNTRTRQVPLQPDLLPNLPSRSQA